MKRTRNELTKTVCNMIKVKPTYTIHGYLLLLQSAVKQTKCLCKVPHLSSSLVSTRCK